MPSSNYFKIVIDDRKRNAHIKKEIENFVISSRDVYGHLTQLLSQAMNFTYDAIRHDTGGVLQPDGNWTGVIGLINRSEVDIAVVPLFITEQRNQAVLYSYPFYISDFTFVTKKPEHKPNMFSILFVFEESVWVVLGVTMIIMSCLIHLIEKKKHSFTEIMTDVIGTSMKQPSSMKPHKTAGKIMTLSWLVGMTFLSMCYMSVLLSFMTFPTLTGVRTVQQLARAVEKGNYKCMTIVGSNTPYLLSTADNKDFNVIGNNMLDNPAAYGYHEDFMRRSQEDIAFIQPRLSINYLSGRYFVSEDHFSLIFAAIAAKKEFCCRSEMDRAIRAICESGLFQKLTNDRDFVNFLTQLSSETPEINSLRVLSVTDIGGALVILLIGYSLSTIAFLFEICFAKMF